MNKPTHLDICSGTGAFSIAFEREGFKTIGFSEIDPYCCALLKQNWPGVINYGDIRDVPAIGCSVITAGDPCQPFSCAGRRLGEADDRYIWPTVLAVVERCKPDCFLGENVVGIANMVLSRRIDDLEGIGYQCKAFDLPSCGVGLPSVERHIWLVASRGEAELQGITTGCLPWPDDEFGEWWQNHARSTGVAGGWYLPKPYVLRSTKGVSNFRNRIAAIGNAVPPPIAQIFARAIMNQLHEAWRQQQPKP